MEIAEAGIRTAVAADDQTKTMDDATDPGAAWAICEIIGLASTAMAAVEAIRLEEFEQSFFP